MNEHHLEIGINIYIHAFMCVRACVYCIWIFSQA